VRLLEREEDEARLVELLPGAGRGGAAVLVGGEAGVGKTAFLRGVEQRVGARVEVLWGVCDPLGTPQPLAPVLDFAPRLLGHGFPGSAGADTAARAVLFRTLLERLSTGRVRLVVIEDVHWADSATLDLLRFLGRRIAGTQALLACSYCDEVLGPRHPARLLLGHLAGAPSVQRLQLRPLSASAVRTLSEGTQLDPLELHRRTGGNAFYVTEVVAMAREAAPDASASGAAEAAAATVPATVRDAVLARVATLTPDARRSLEAVAVLGARAEPWLLDTLLGNAEAGIDACVASGMLVHTGDALGFRHELARDAVAGAIPPEHGRRLHAAALAALEASPDTRGDVARLAHHAVQAHDAVAVRAHAPEAGRQAVRLGAYREATQQFAKALRYAQRLPNAERAALLQAFAQAHRVLAYTHEALLAQEEAVRLWRKVGDARAEGAALARLVGFYIHRGRSDEAERASRRSLELLGALGPSLELGHAQVVQAALRMRARDAEDAVEWGRRALASAEQFGDLELAVRAHCRIAAGLLQLGEAGGEEHLASARRVAEDAGLHRVLALADVTAASIALEYGRYPEARLRAASGIAVCREFDLDSDGLYLQSVRASADLYQGDWRAAEVAAEAIARSRDDEALSRIPALVTLGRLRSRRGEPGARGALDEALELAERTRTLQRLGPVRTARAEEAWLAGDVERTRREAAAAYPLALERRHPWFAGELGFWLRRAGAEVELPAWAAAPFRLEAEGASVEAAAVWEALGCPYEEARALASSGRSDALERALRVFESLGAHPAAHAAARQLRSLGVRAIPRGPRPRTRAHPAGLTPREAQVLALLARGLTDRALADQLHISPKTAGHHVSSILAKLGVRRRTEAAAAAHQRGLLTGVDGTVGGPETGDPVPPGSGSRSPDGTAS